MRAVLGAWLGHKGGAYLGAILRFFESVHAARSHVTSYPGTVRVRNVLVEWSSGSPSEEGWRKAVRGCLLTAPPSGGTPPTRQTPRADLATFAGYWGGHTRRLQITSSGLGLELTNSGCCTRMYRLTFQITSVSGTLTRATAVYRVTSFERIDRDVPRLHTGEMGRLQLRNGIVMNALTRVYFCSEPAWWATGACGA